MVTLWGRGDHKKAVAKGEAEAGEKVEVEAASAVATRRARMVAASVTKATFGAFSVTSTGTL